MEHPTRLLPCLKYRRNQRYEGWASLRFEKNRGNTIVFEDLSRNSVFCGALPIPLKWVLRILGYIANRFVLGLFLFHAFPHLYLPLSWADYALTNAHGALIIMVLLSLRAVVAPLAFSPPDPPIIHLLHPISWVIFVS